MSKIIKPSNPGERGLKPSSPPPITKPDNGGQKHGLQPSSPPPVTKPKK